MPKGERADWMVEKLSELGTTAFIPLATGRSVVLPEGKNKRERWARLATESAKQSRRTGVMRVGELTGVDALLGIAREINRRSGLVLLHRRRGAGRRSGRRRTRGRASIVALIGPEGGWTADELSRFAAAGLTAVR